MRWEPPSRASWNPYPVSGVTRSSNRTLRGLFRMRSSNFSRRLTAREYGRGLTRLRGALELLAELAADAGAEALEAHGHRALADAHALRDLARREGTFQVEEADRLLLGAFAQPVDHLADGAQLRFLLHLLVRGGGAAVGQAGLAAGLFGRLVVRRARGEIGPGAGPGGCGEPGGKSIPVLGAGPSAESAHRPPPDHRLRPI